VVGKRLEVPSSGKPVKRASGEMMGKADPVRVAKRCVVTRLFLPIV
jgi:NAD-dependent histone deacetylase SIR2